MLRITTERVYPKTRRNPQGKTEIYVQDFPAAKFTFHEKSGVYGASGGYGAQSYMSLEQDKVVAERVSNGTPRNTSWNYSVKSHVWPNEKSTVTDTRRPERVLTGELERHFLSATYWIIENGARVASVWFDDYYKD